MQMAAVTGSGRASGLDFATIHFSGRRVAGARLVDGSHLQGIHTYGEWKPGSCASRPARLHANAQACNGNADGTPSGTRSL